MLDREQETGQAEVRAIAKGAILVVDDDPDVLVAITRTLRSLECNLHTAPSGEEALDMLSSIDGLSIIISDMHMPGMNGIEFLKQARKSLPDVARILLTGATKLDVALAALEDGTISRFVTKPWDSEKLRASMRCLMKS